MSLSQPLYDRIGVNYDGTRRADPYLADRLIAHLGDTDQGSVLDLACGTGNYTSALSERGIHVAGIDISTHMLAEARSKNPSLPLCCGDVTLLPFPEDTFKGAICTLATHHFPSLLSAFREINRVLESGRFVILTATPEQMKGYWLNEYFPKALRDSIVQMPSFEETHTALANAGFSKIESEPYDIREDLQDHFLYSGKHEPEAYLDEAFRAGISTFSSLAQPEEVQAGCEKLEADIRTGRIEDIIESYSHGKGDYLFVIAHKS